MTYYSGVERNQPTRVITMFRVFEKVSFFDDNCDEITERELIDDDYGQAVMQRDGKILVIERGMDDHCFLHTIENDEDERFRVERTKIQLNQPGNNHEQSRK